MLQSKKEATGTQIVLISSSEKSWSTDTILEVMALFLNVASASVTDKNWQGIGRDIGPERQPTMQGASLKMLQTAPSS